MNEQLWNTDGVTLTGIKWRNPGNNCPSAALSTPDSVETSLGLNPGLQVERHSMFQLV